MAQTAIATDAAGLLAGRVDIPVADGKMPAYRAAPQGKKNLPTLLVVSEIFGVHEYIQDICRRRRTWGIWRWRPSCSRARATRRATDIPKLQAEIISRCPTRRCSATGRRIGLGRRAWRRRGPTGHPGVLLGRTPVWLYAAHNPKLRAGAAGTGSWAASPAS